MKLTAIVTASALMALFLPGLQAEMCYTTSDCTVPQSNNKWKYQADGKAIYTAKGKVYESGVYKDSSAERCCQKFHWESVTDPKTGKSQMDWVLVGRVSQRKPGGDCPSDDP